MNSYRATVCECGDGDVILQFYKEDTSDIMISINFGSFYFEVPEYLDKLVEIKDAITLNNDLSHAIESSNDGIVLSVKKGIFTYQPFRYGSNISIDLNLKFQINPTLITAFEDLITIGIEIHADDEDTDDDSDE